MDIKDIICKIDHTALSQTTTFEDIKILIDEAVFANAATVCIPPCYVKRAKAYANGKIRICTVIGFPNGYNSTEAKKYETSVALMDGADEIDVVINVGYVKSGDFDKVKEELEIIRGVCEKKTLKVIIETCYLNEEEKIKMCKVVSEIGAEYIKTSTGFGSHGAKKEDVILMKEHIGKGVKIKAAGGIRTLEDGKEYVLLGCDRIGSSAIIKGLKNK